MPLQRQHSGFTVIELLAVVLIVSIVSAVTVLSVESVRQFSVERTASQIRFALRFAQEEAHRRGTPITTSFDVSSRTIEVYQPDFNAASPGKIPVLHPLKKTPFIEQLASEAMAGSAIDVQALFWFSDYTNAREVTFNAAGHPGKMESETSFVPLLASGVWRGAWQQGGITYSKDDWVVYNDVEYNALQGHSSGLSFELDLSAGRWAVRSPLAQISVSGEGHKYDISVRPVTGLVKVYQR